MNTKILKEFYNYIMERQRIWHKRFVLGEKAPWTQDKILRQYKFCNVYRELDAGTKHLINKIHNDDVLRPRVKLFNIILYRRFNVRNFFGKILPRPVDYYKFDFECLENLLDEAKKKHKLFNDAYLLTQRHYNPRYRKSDKHVQILMAMRDLAKNFDSFCLTLESSTMREAWELLQTIPLVGPFLAFQIVQDISYLEKFVSWRNSDFVFVGPGAMPSIERIFGNKTDPWTKCLQIGATQMAYLGKEWDKIRHKGAYSKWKWLSPQNIQHNLCEFRKYTNLKSGKRARKRKFKGGDCGLF